MKSWEDATTRIIELERRRDQLEARLARTKAVAAINDKKRENRRRFLAGSVLLSLLDGNDETWSIVAGVLLDRTLKRPSERGLFGLD
jgi:type II secretory pathway component PulJ